MRSNRSAYQTHYAFVGDVPVGLCAHLPVREAKQAGRIVDENAFPDLWIRSDDGQDIEEIAFVGCAARNERISMRPIGAPEHAIGRYFDNGLGEGYHVEVGQA